MRPPHPLTIGVSSCLLGEEVRWDGDHKRDAWITGSLVRWARLVPVCPEVGIGMTVPRPAIQLVGTLSAPRVLGIDDPSTDVSEALREFGRRKGRELMHMDGFLFRRISPSCGLQGVPVYREDGSVASRGGRGLFAAALLRALPHLPAEQDGRLDDPRWRNHFLERVFAYARWRALLAGGFTAAGLREFHARHRLVLRAHSLRGADKLERLAAKAEDAQEDRREDGPNDSIHSVATTADAYGKAFSDLLSRRATRPGHTAVLRLLAECLAPRLDAGDRKELRQALAAYRDGRCSLQEPLTLLGAHFRRHPHPEAAGQTYLNSSPAEWALRFAPPG